MKNKIDTTNWGEFIFGRIFEMQPQIEISPKIAIEENEKDSKILYPYYGQSSINNGIIDYIKLNDKYLNNKKSDIMIMIHSNNHLAFKLDTPFYLKDGHGATSLFTHPNLTPNNVQYIITILNSTMETKFNYDMKATKEALKELKIKLPIDEKGNPDFDYMENYIKSIKEKSQKRIDNLSTKKENKNKIDTTDWKEFHLKDLFIFEQIKGDIQAPKVNEGEFPLVSSGIINNGICKYIEKQPTSTLFDENKLTVDMFGKVFFQTQKFYSVAHARVNVLTPIDTLNRYTGLFIASILEEVTLPKYQFNDMCSQKALKNEKIKLPSRYNSIKKSYEPNWEYMENYMKNIEYKTKGNKIRMKDYYNYNYEEKDIEEYVESRKENFYGFDGLHDTNVNVPPCHIYKFHKEDISFENNTITINIGNYANKKLDYLLKQLFIPRDEMCFDLKKAMETNNTKLILFNNIGNQSKNFFDYINEFFKDYAIDIEKQGIWE